jgi:hypothetical protein
MTQYLFCARHRSCAHTHLTIKRTELFSPHLIPSDIGACKGGVVQIEGKCKSITVNSCTGTGIVFADCIGPFEVMRSKKVKVQVTGVAPLFQLDKCENCTVFFSAAAVEQAKLVTAECSSINVMVPDGDDDMKEVALPDQTTHHFANVDGADVKLRSAPVVDN